MRTTSQRILSEVAACRAARERDVTKGECSCRAACVWEVTLVSSSILTSRNARFPFLHTQLMSVAGVSVAPKSFYCVVFGGVVRDSGER